MTKVGLTGGIGSGKSLIAGIFNKMGVPVYNSDFEAKELYHKDPELKTDIIKQFGKEVYLSDGKINKAYLANLVFADKSKLELLNKLIHPRVQKHFSDWFESRKSGQYIIKEAAILIESGAYKQVDKIIVVFASDTIRIQRVLKRDNVTRNSVLERISSQMSQEELIKYADFIIDNGENVALLPQVMHIHSILTNGR